MRDTATSQSPPNRVPATNSSNRVRSDTSPGTIVPKVLTSSAKLYSMEECSDHRKVCANFATWGTISLNSISSRQQFVFDKREKAQRSRPAVCLIGNKRPFLGNINPTEQPFGHTRRQIEEG